MLVSVTIEKLLGFSFMYGPEGTNTFIGLLSESVSPVGIIKNPSSCTSFSKTVVYIQL